LVFGVPDPSSASDRAKFKACGASWIMIEVHSAPISQDRIAVY
jgi:hypothetical protein